MKEEWYQAWRMVRAIAHRHILVPMDWRIDVPQVRLYQANYRLWLRDFINT